MSVDEREAGRVQAVVDDRRHRKAADALYLRRGDGDERHPSGDRSEELDEVVIERAVDSGYHPSSGNRSE